MSNLLMPKNSHIEIWGINNIQIEMLIIKPESEIKGVSLILHPLPIAGGTNTNKIVQTLAKLANSLGYIAYCPNFRSVGSSTGVFDNGVSELQDSIEIYIKIKLMHVNLPIMLSGFSFGGAVVSNLAMTGIDYNSLILISPSVVKHDCSVLDINKTIVVYGQDDEVIPMPEVYAWANKECIVLNIFPATGHYYHGKLVMLQQHLHRQLLGII